MAIYHLNAKTGNRGHDGTGRRGKNKKPKAGQSAKAKFDYISREGKYTRDPGEVLFSESGNMPAWAAENPGNYWDAADLYERKNGRLFKEVEFALPIELTLEQQIDTIRAFADHVAGADNLPFTYAVHAGRGSNPHCHLMLNERINDGIERTAETWFKRAANKNKPAETGGARKSERLKPNDWLDNTREAWANFANDALDRHGHNQRIDHRTLEEQGIDRKAQIHLGPAAKAMAERGILTDRLEYLEQINEYNQLRTEEAELELEIAVTSDVLDAESRLESSEAEADALDIQPPVAATQPYVPDEPATQVDDELSLARQSQQRDVEDHIGRKHWLQIRAELRELYSTQQRLYDEREAAEEAEWNEWISRPDVCSATGRIHTEMSVDATIQRERALPENQPPEKPPEPSPAASKPSPTPPPRKPEKPPQAAPQRATAPVEPQLESTPQAPAESFDAKGRALEIVQLETPAERHAAMRDAAQLELDDFDALSIELEPLMHAEGRLTEEGQQLRDELMSRDISSERAPRVQSEEDFGPWSGQSGPEQSQDFSM